MGKSKSDKNRDLSYLRQPRKPGNFFFRMTYRDLDGQLCEINKSLMTSDVDEAIRIRDSDFLPFIKNLTLAKAQLDVIVAKWPSLQKNLDELLNRPRWKHSCPEPAKTSISRALASWTEDIQDENKVHYLAPTTAMRYSDILLKFSSWVGQDHLLSEISREKIVEYRDKRKEDKRSIKTVSLEITALKSFFSYCMEKYQIPENPASTVVVKQTKAQQARHEEMHKRRAPTPEEFDRICTAFPEARAYSKQDLQDFAIAVRYTGIRREVLCNLLFQDLRFCEPHANVEAITANPALATPFEGQDVCANKILCLILTERDGMTIKSGRKRVVPVADKLRPILVKRYATSGSVTSPIFPMAYGAAGKFGKSWNRLAKKIAPGMCIHGARHYAASEMVNAGVDRDIRTVILGHKDGSVHSGYVHTKIAPLKEAIDKIA